MPKSLITKHIIEQIVKPSVDDAAKKKTIEEVRNIFQDAGSIDFNSKETHNSLVNLAKAFQTVFTAAGNTEIDFTQMINTSSTTDLFTNLGKIAGEKFQSAWNSVIQNFGNNNLDLSPAELMKQWDKRKNDLSIKKEKSYKKLKRYENLSDLQYMIEDNSIKPFSLKEIESKETDVDEFALSLKEAFIEAETQLTDVTRGTKEYYQLLIHIREIILDMYRMAGTIEKHPNIIKDKEILEDYDYGNLDDMTIDAIKGTQKDFNEYLSKYTEVYKKSLKSINAELEQIAIKEKEIAQNNPELIDQKKATAGLKTLNEIEEAYTRILNKERKGKKSVNVIAEKNILSALDYKSGEKSLLQLSRGYNNSINSGENWEIQYQWLVKFVREYESYAAREDADTAKLSKHKALYEQLKPMAANAENMLRNVLNMAKDIPLVGMEGTYANATNNDNVNKNNESFTEQDKLENIKKLITYIDEKYLSIGKHLSDFLSDAQGETREFNEELKNILSTLNLIDEKGNLKFDIKNNGEDGSGTTHNGALISDDFVLIERGNYQDVKNSKLPSSTQNAYEDGINVAKVLGYVPSKYNNSFFDVQSVAKGKNLFENGVISQNVINATNEQIQQLINAFIKARDYGFNIENGGSNIVYDKEKGFSFYDLEEMSSDDTDFWNKLSEDQKKLYAIDDLFSLFSGLNRDHTNFENDTNVQSFAERIKQIIADNNIISKNAYDSKGRNYEDIFDDIFLGDNDGYDLDKYLSELKQEIESSSSDEIDSNNQKIKSYEELCDIVKEYYNLKSKLKDEIVSTGMHGDAETVYDRYSDIEDENVARQKMMKDFNDLWSKREKMKTALKTGETYSDKNGNQGIATQHDIDNATSEINALAAAYMHLGGSIEDFSSKSKRAVAEDSFKLYQESEIYDKAQELIAEDYNKPIKEKMYDIEGRLTKQQINPNSLGVFNALEIDSGGVEEKINKIANAIGIEIPQAAQKAEDAVDEFNNSLKETNNLNQGFGTGDASSADLKSAQDKVEQLSKELTDAESENKRLRDEYDAYTRISMDEKSTLQNDLDIANEQIKVAQSQQAQAEQESIKKDAIIQDLKDQLAKTKSSSDGSRINDTDNKTEINDLEKIGNQLGEITNKVDEKTQAFRDESDVVDSIVTSEVGSLEKLENKVTEIKSKFEILLSDISTKQPDIYTPDVNTQDFVAEGEAAESAINKENQALQTLRASLQLTTQRINTKTDAFVLEGKTVGQVIGKEISALKNLQTNANNVNKTVLDLIKNLRLTKTATKYAQPKTQNSSNSQSPNATPGAVSSKDYASETKIREQSILKLRAELMTTGKLTKGLEQGLDHLFVTASQITDKTGFDNWNRVLSEITNNIKIKGIFDKANDKDETSKYEKLVALKQQEYDLEVRLLNVKGANETSVLQNQLQQTRALIQAQDQLTKGSEQDVKLKQQEAEWERKIEQLRASRKDSQDAQAQKNKESQAAQYLKEQEKLVKELIPLYKQLGEARAKGENTQGIRKSIKDKRSNLNSTKNIEDRFLSATNEGYDKSRSKVLSDLGKLYKNRDKLRANYESNGRNPKDLVNLKLLSEEIDRRKKNLQLTQQEIKVLREKGKIAYDAQKRVNRATIQKKYSDAEWAERKKSARVQAGTNLANSAISAGSKTVMNVIGEENLSADIEAKARELQKAIEELDELKRKTLDSLNKGVKADTDQLARQTSNVNKLTDEIGELLKIHQKFSGDNSKVISDNIINFNGLDKDSEEYKRRLQGVAEGFLKAKLQSVNFNAATGVLTGKVRTGTNEFTEYAFAVDKVDGKIKKLNNGSKKTEGFFSGINRKMKEAAQYVIGSVSIYDLWNQIRQGIQYVKEIDSALTELKKVTDETEETYNRFLNTAAKTADKVGSTISEVVSSTADWARLGYSLEDAANLAESTSVLLNVSEFQSIDDATSALVSTMQAFGYAAKDSMHVVDVMNEIGNNYAVSSDGIATALQDSASSLMAANNSYQEAVALIASANKVVQDPNSVGSALRTISLRLRGTSVDELSEAGEETDGAITSKSKLRSKIKTLSGIDILTDSGAYKSTYEIKYMSPYRETYMLCI